MTKGATDEEARRSYWIDQMDAAYAFMQTIMGLPLAECGESLAPLREIASGGGVEVEFSTSKIGGTHDRLFYLREGLVDDFVGIARDMNDRGWILRVEDGFRTRQMQRDLAREKRVLNVILKKLRWELEGRSTTAAHAHRRLTALIATCPKIGTHMSGSAIDISVLSGDTGAEIDRGAPYLEMSELTPMESPFPPDQARRNRQEITEVFARRGFVAYPYEFWHYSKGDALQAYLAGSREPARYGPVDRDGETGRTSPIERPTEWLNSPEEVAILMERTPLT